MRKVFVKVEFLNILSGIQNPVGVSGYGKLLCYIFCSFFFCSSLLGQNKGSKTENLPNKEDTQTPLGQEGTYYYYDGTAPKILEDPKIRIKRDKAGIYLSSFVGFGSGHAHYKRWREFKSFLAVDLLAFIMTAAGASMVHYVRYQIVRHGYRSGNFSGLLREPYLSKSWRIQRILTYVFGIAFVSMGSLTLLVSRIVQIRDNVDFYRYLKPKIEKMGFDMGVGRGIEVSFSKRY